MNAPAKFLFDMDFGRGGKAAGGGISLAQHQSALAEAEARGFRCGQAAGRAEAAQETAGQLAQALARSAAALEKIGSGLVEMERRVESEAVQVAVAVATKLAAALISREPFEEIAALAADCFRHLVGVPHVVVRVGDSLYETARARLQEIASRCGFEGRLVVLAEPEIALGDCRIEWADGGAVLDRAATQAAIAEMVERHLAAGREAVRRPT